MIAPISFIRSRRIVWIAVWALITLSTLMSTTLSNAADIVYIASESGNGGHTRISGKIVDYTGLGLVMNLPAGLKQTFPANRILRIETQTSVEQAEGKALFEKGEFGPALAKFQQARVKDTRTWVRRQLTARIVWCYRSLGQYPQAGEEFLLLVRSDPETFHFGCIPLAWITAQPSAELEQAARQWLDRKEIPAAVLLGASYLLSTDVRPEAQSRLRRLAAGTNRRIALIATAQLWRIGGVTADRTEVVAWEKMVQRLPESLQAGPYYAVATAWASQRDWEKAALAWMRIPILFPEHRSLAARSLLDAGAMLEKLDQPLDATRLYRESMDRFPKTSSAKEARKRLEQISEES